MNDKIKFKGQGKTIATGQGSQGLVESVPKYSRRTGDKVLYGKINNNAKIVIGQDRDAFAFGKNGTKEVNATDPDQDSKESGYSSHHGAGAIDLVVGAGAPYPSDLERLGLPNSLPPLYRTLRDPKLTVLELSDSSNHDGYVMDAARIYISQKTDIDQYFGLTDIKMASPSTSEEKIKGGAGFKINLDVKPSSAIILKADKLRMHARRDIKIIAGGDIDSNGAATKIDSNGNVIKTTGGGVHLIAGNGLSNFSRQEPIPKGYRLAELINEITLTLHNILENQNLLIKSQMTLDTALANEIYASPAGTTCHNPISQINDVLDKFNKIRASFNLYFQKFFNMPLKLEKPGKPFSESYFLSRYNTTN